MVTSSMFQGSRNPIKSATSPSYNYLSTCQRLQQSKAADLLKQCRHIRLCRFWSSSFRHSPQIGITTTWNQSISMSKRMVTQYQLPRRITNILKDFHAIRYNIYFCAKSSDLSIGLRSVWSLKIHGNRTRFEQIFDEQRSSCNTSSHIISHNNIT